MVKNSLASHCARRCEYPHTREVHVTQTRSEMKVTKNIVRPPGERGIIRDTDRDARDRGETDKRCTVAAFAGAKSARRERRRSLRLVVSSRDDGERTQ